MHVNFDVRRLGEEGEDRLIEDNQDRILNSLDLDWTMRQSRYDPLDEGVIKNSGANDGRGRGQISQTLCEEGWTEN